MALGYDITLDRREMARIRTALSKAPDAVKQRVSRSAMEFGEEVASAAAGRVVRHPSGLWDGARMTGYQVRERDDWMVQVRTPGGRAGKALAMSEFAQADYSGKKLGQSLDAVYGAPGRILWDAYDQRERKWIETIERAVDDAAEDIERGR